MLILIGNRDQSYLTVLGLHSGLHDVRLFLNEGAHLSLTEQLKEGIRERHVDESVVLQRLGQEHTQEPEELRRPVS